MTLFQIFMLGLSAFFAYKVYQHVQTIQDDDNTNSNFNTDEQKEPAVFDPEALVKRADEAFMAGDLEQAFALLDEANIKGPNNSEVLSKLGFICTKLGRDNEAISYYQEAIDLDENDDMLHNALASLFRKTGDFTKAQIHYKKALEIDDAYDVTYFNYANLLADMNQKAEAIKMYEKALEINPELDEAKTEIEKLKDEV